MFVSKWKKSTNVRACQNISRTPKSQRACLCAVCEHYHTSISTKRAAKNNRVAHSTLWSMISKSWMSASTSNHRAPKIAIQPEGQNSTSSQDHWKRTENTLNTTAILLPVVARKGFKIMESWKTADR